MTATLVLRVLVHEWRRSATPHPVAIDRADDAITVHIAPGTTCETVAQTLYERLRPHELHAYQRGLGIPEGTPLEQVYDYYSRDYPIHHGDVPHTLQ